MQLVAEYIVRMKCEHGDTEPHDDWEEEGLFRCFPPSHVEAEYLTITEDDDSELVDWIRQAVAGLRPDDADMIQITARRI